MRIVSLLPSATDIVGFLGLADQLVGVSHECDYPFNDPGSPGGGERPRVTASILPHGLTPGEIDAYIGTAVSAAGLAGQEVPVFLESFFSERWRVVAREQGIVS